MRSSRATTLALCLSLLLALPARAQRPGTPGSKRFQPSLTMGPTGGFKAGALLSMPIGAGLRTLQPGGKSITFTNGYGLVGGGVFNFRLLPEASVQLEALLSTRGFSRTSTFPLNQRIEELTVRQLCVELPLLAKYNLSVFYAEAGIVSALALRTTYTQRITFPDERLETDGSLPDARRFNLNAALGVGVELPEGYFFGLRYLQGLSKLGNKPADTEQAALNGQNLTCFAFQATGGYIFRHQTFRNGGPLKHTQKKKKKARKH